MINPASSFPVPLHLIFLAGGNGDAARLAAQLTNAQANGCVQAHSACQQSEIEAILRRSVPTLTVVIHSRDASGPMIAYNHGGRIDWHLDVDVSSVSAPELTSQLHLHTMRLLVDLGVMPTNHIVPQRIVTACTGGMSPAGWRADGARPELAAHG